MFRITKVKVKAGITNDQNVLSYKKILNSLLINFNVTLHFLCFKKENPTKLMKHEDILKIWLLCMVNAFDNIDFFQYFSKNNIL